MLLAHLSDPHLTTGPLAAGPAAGLDDALGRVLGLEPLPDAVVVTGDLADQGRPGEYAQLRDLLAPAGAAGVPVHLAVGNHDARDGVLAAFAGTPQLGGGSTTHYAVDLPGASLVVLDSLIPGQGPGRVGAVQLAWLEEVLAARADGPVLLALHHPPVPVGIPFLDAMGLLDADALADVVNAHPQVVRVLAGHVHRVTTTAFAGTVATTAGSTHRQSALDLRAAAAARMGYLDEPPTLLLHQLDERTGGTCVTHVVPVHGAAPHWSLPVRGAGVQPSADGVR